MARPPRMNGCRRCGKTSPRRWDGQRRRMIASTMTTTTTITTMVQRNPMREASCLGAYTATRGRRWQQQMNERALCGVQVPQTVRTTQGTPSPGERAPAFLHQRPLVPGLSGASGLAVPRTLSLSGWPSVNRGYPSGFGSSASPCADCRSRPTATRQCEDLKPAHTAWRRLHTVRQIHDIEMALALMVGVGWMAASPIAVVVFPRVQGGQRLSRAHGDRLGVVRGYTVA